ncbi:MAG: NifU family protein [Nitrospinota bacterium]|nr:NifU family protein [Nitrospinota bacterium]MDH5678030.1 NifU family protein [Nitrospinota bacterium]
MTATTPKKEYGTSPKHRGVYFLEEATAMGLAFVSTKVEDTKIFWLIDPEEEKVVKAKFFTYGGSDSVATGEAICDIAQDSPMQEAFSITGEQVISHLEQSNYYPFNKDSLINQINSLIANLKQDYPVALAKLSLSGKKASELKKATGSAEDEKWLKLSKSERIELINQAIDGQVRDALAMDGGDIDILDIKNDWDIYAEFQGACSSCSASIGSTFLVVENVIKAKVNERLTLVANSFPW